MDKALIRESPPPTDRRSYHWATPPTIYSLWTIKSKKQTSMCTHKLIYV